MIDTLSSSIYMYFMCVISSLSCNCVLIHESFEQKEKQNTSLNQTHKYVSHSSIDHVETHYIFSLLASNSS